MAAETQSLCAEIDIFADPIPDRVKELVRGICADYLGGVWEESSEEQFTLRALSGGMVNIILLVGCSSSATAHHAVVRIYASQDADAVLRDTAVFTMLAEKRMGPRLLAVVPGGRIEEYIHSRPVDRDIIQDNFTCAVASRMARMHALSMPIRKDLTPPEDVDSKKWLNEVSTQHDFIDIDLVTLKLPDEMRNKLPVSVSMADLHGEIAGYVEFMYTSTAAGSKVVFAHTDLHGMNMLLAHGCVVEEDGRVTRNGQPADGGLMFIDFEWACYKHRAFDIANTLAEYAFDYTLPGSPSYVCDFEMCLGETGARKRRLFVEKYVDEVYSNSPLPSDFTGDRDADTTALMSSVDAFTACVNLHWGIWSLRQAQLTALDADFWSIGVEKLALYYLQKGAMDRRL